MEISFRILICIVIVFAVSVNGKFVPCGGSAIVKKVFCDGTDMDTTELCKLQRGSNAQLNVTFQAAAATTSLKSVCHGIIRGVPIPFDGIDTKGCDGMKPKCPLAKKTTYEFTTQIAVKTYYPSIKLAIKWEELDEATGKDILCLVIPAQIV